MNLLLLQARERRRVQDEESARQNPSSSSSSSTSSKPRISIKRKRKTPSGVSRSGGGNSGGSEIAGADTVGTNLGDFFEDADPLLRENRLLICAPSNAAIDEVVRRLIQPGALVCADGKPLNVSCSDPSYLGPGGLDSFIHSF